MIEEIQQHFEKEYPREACGVIGIIKGKRQASIPTSTDIGAIRAVEGTDQQDLYNTMFGHIFRKYRTLV